MEEEIGSLERLIAPLVIDTDILVDHLRGETRAGELVRRIESGKYLAYFSTITEAELYSGRQMHRREERRSVDLLLSLMRRVEVDGEIARRAGDIRRMYEVELPNALIAATALSSRARLVTRNLKHYDTIRRLRIVTPEQLR